jgi:5-formyltetrahydrofolate cyclo-ligase
LRDGIIVRDNGAREPITPSDAGTVETHHFDVILVPGLAFDRNGARLGQGGGWYDRVLADAPHVAAIGICFDCQMVPHIPSESHDRRVALVVTETQVIDVVKSETAPPEQRHI